MNKSKVFIVVDAGLNHEGSLRMAIKMAYEAKKAGADAIKFQTYQPKNLNSKIAYEQAIRQKPSRAYPWLNTMKWLDEIKSVDFTLGRYQKLKRYCDKLGIIFLSTPWDYDGLKKLRQLNVDYYKIGSGDLNYLPFLEAVAKLNKKVIISTGLGTIKEIKNAISVVRRYNDKDFYLMHCNVSYPTKPEWVNLAFMEYLMQELKDVHVGFSDHTLGIDIAINAVVLGARIIEKHFTLKLKNNLREGMLSLEHSMSLTPKTLKEMVRKIREVESLNPRELELLQKSARSQIFYGKINKELNPVEKEEMLWDRRGMVAKRNLKKGTVLKRDCFDFKRPAVGIAPDKYMKYIGRIIKRNKQIDEVITPLDLK